MNTAWYRFRAELRTRWRSVFALALLGGVAGGATLAAVAGARRTDSAYSRLVAATEAWDVLVNPDRGSSSALRSGPIARLPMVASAARLNGVVVAPADLRGADDFGRFGIVLAPESGAGSKLGRPKILDGRTPDPRHATEVLVNPVLAKQAALVVGLPLGFVLGRWAWSALANNLGTESEPVVPIALLLVAIPIVLGLLNLVAYVPGRIAARTRPAIALRSE